MNEMVTTSNALVPDWTWEFHGHKCPFMPMGYRMGLMAMRELGVEREKGHRTFALTEMGEGHPNTCMNDGIQASTGCTYGKLLMERLNYGKFAFVLYKPGKGAVRVSVKPEFVDAVSKSDFAKLRKNGVEPSEIQPEVADAVVQVVLKASDSEMFNVERLPDFKFETPAAKFDRARCSKCGEYLFERYARVVEGKTLCIPCSGRVESRLSAPKGGL